MTAFAADRLVWDMVVPWAPSVGNDFALLDRYRAAGHAYVSLTVAGDDSGLAAAMHRVAEARRQLRERNTTLMLATSVDDVRRARTEGKLAVGLHLEGTECLERDVDAIDSMVALGIRHSALSFNRNNSAAGGCSDLGNVGLSRLGRRYLTRMNELGVLVDLSHASERASFEAIERSASPVVFSHSNARALHGHYRNVSDALATACAAAGGLVGLSGSSAYLGHGAPLVDGLFRHIDHFVQRLGPRHVGLGTDYVVDAAAVSAIFIERPDEWPVDESADYRDLRYLPPEALPEVVALMVRAGYDEAAVSDILGGNYLRIAAEVWTT